MPKLLIAALVSSAVPCAALAQVPQSGEAAPKSPPNGVYTPAPVPEVAPGVPAQGSASVVPEQIAPPGQTNAAPLAGAPSGTGGAPAVPGGTAAPAPPLAK